MTRSGPSSRKEGAPRETPQDCGCVRARHRCTRRGNRYRLRRAGPPPAPGAIHYQTQIGANGTSLDTVLDAGTFRVAGDVVDVVDPAGTTVGTVPLTYRVAGVDVPLVPSVDGGKLTLTPAIPAQGVSALNNVDARQDAYSNMISEIEKGWVGGGQMNAQIGAGVGAVVGCVLFLFVGCIPGAAIGGVIGAATGISNANPAVQPAIFDFIGTLY
ncbi:hypothetical protein GS533_002325 [Prescottella equi]|nr:hypothetical protein GS533_002325 [Prescottella equi]